MLRKEISVKAVELYSQVTTAHSSVIELIEKEEEITRRSRERQIKLRDAANILEQIGVTVNKVVFSPLKGTIAERIPQTLGILDLEKRFEDLKPKLISVGVPLEATPPTTHTSRENASTSRTQAGNDGKYASFFNASQNSLLVAPENSTGEAHTAGESQTAATSEINHCKRRRLTTETTDGSNVLVDPTEGAVIGQSTAHSLLALGAKSVERIEECRLTTAVDDKMVTATTDASSPGVPGHDDASSCGYPSFDDDDFSNRRGFPYRVSVPRMSGKNYGDEQPAVATSVEDYLCGLSVKERRELEAKALAMRNNKLQGTMDTRVLRFLNTQDGHDNLYIVCMQETDEVPISIHVVQADPYDMWCNEPVAEEVDVNSGQWHCTILKPYYRNANDPIEKVSWRYQVHNIVSVKSKNDREQPTVRFGKGYCSFDDHRKRGGYQNSLMDWAGPVSLLPYPTGCWLYGPFSWNKGTTKPHMIEKSVWIAALPSILNCKTTKGIIFSHGFEDKTLHRVANGKKSFLTNELINDAKKDKPTHNESTYVPVEYGLIDFEKRRMITRLVPVTVTKAKRPFLFGIPTDGNEDGADTSPNSKNRMTRPRRLGGFMMIETEEAKKRENRKEALQVDVNMMYSNHLEE